MRGIKEFSEDHIVSDPALRIPIDDFDPEIRDEVRRAYVLKGPTQPTGFSFPTHGNNSRSFCEAWYKKYEWLEYSVQKDAAYCFYCFLFRHDPLHEKFGHGVFTKVGFKTWKNAYKILPSHVGGPNSVHNQSKTAYVDFKNQRASVSHKVVSHTKESEVKYETRLTASLDCASYLLMQGHAFRGHDESSSSSNKGNFLEMIDWYKERKEEVRIAFEELCPKTARLLAPLVPHTAITLHSSTLVLTSRTKGVFSSQQNWKFD